MRYHSQWRAVYKGTAPQSFSIHVPVVPAISAQIHSPPPPASKVPQPTKRPIAVRKELVASPNPAATRTNCISGKPGAMLVPRKMISQLVVPAKPDATQVKRVVKVHLEDPVSPDVPDDNPTVQTIACSIGAIKRPNFAQPAAKVPTKPPSMVSKLRVGPCGYAPAKSRPECEEVMCSRCNKMVPVDRIGNRAIVIRRGVERHSRKCFYESKGEATEESKLTLLRKIDCALVKLRHCMEKSVTLVKCMGHKLVAEVIRHCREAEELAAASPDSLFVLQEKIDRLLEIHNSLGAQLNPTTFQYIQRIMYCLKVQCIHATVL